MSKHMKLNLSDKHNSTVYLALLCLLYFFITSNYLPISSNQENPIEEDFLYIEITEDGASTVLSLPGVQDLEEIKMRYDFSENVISGDKIVIGEDSVSVSSMSGRKRISLGIPIGINSATSEDLQAIPGIGPALAQRIVKFRESKGKFKSIYKLDSIEGIGRIKFESIKQLYSLD